MRPRFMNRGSEEQVSKRILEEWASMRPRFMNRGSESTAERDTWSWRGFNEAPIHESGK